MTIGKSCCSFVRKKGKSDIFFGVVSRKYGIFRPFQHYGENRCEIPRIRCIATLGYQTKNIIFRGVDFSVFVDMYLAR